MPASEELKARIDARFGDADSQILPSAELVAGWLILHRGWGIEMPRRLLMPYKEVGKIPDDEFDCLIYLMHEWHYSVISVEKEAAA